MPARVRRSTELVGDLNLFKTKKQAYTDFIDRLVSRFTEPNIQHGNIKVTKRGNGVTKVTIKDSATDAQIGFIYRNSDLYIVGLVVGREFFIDSVVYGEEGKKIPDSWKGVIGVQKTITVPSFIYGNILRKGEKTVLQIGKLGESLQQLVQLKDKDMRPYILEHHLSPFVVAFAEAIRFPVVKRLVQESIRKSDGTLKLSESLVKKLSLGHPDERTPEHVFTVYSLMMSWGKLSDRVWALYGDEPINLPAITKNNYDLHLDKSQLNALLGVAKSENQENRRRKRDLSSSLVSSLHHTPTLLDHQIGYIDKNRNLLQDHSSSSWVNVHSITHTPDVIGALHLLVVGILYLARKKLEIPLANVERTRDPRDALVVAIDITERMRCFLRSSAFEKWEVGYEEELELQRQIAQALVRGNSVDSVCSAFLEQHFSDAEGYEDTLESPRKQLIETLANESGSMQVADSPGHECFQ